MKVIIKRVVEEPAVAIGLLLSIALGIVTLINGTEWDWNTILLVVGPFLAALGIRTQVKPMAKIKAEEKAKALHNLKGA